MLTLIAFTTFTFLPSIVIFALIGIAMGQVFVPEADEMTSEEFVFEPEPEITFSGFLSEEAEIELLRSLSTDLEITGLEVVPWTNDVAFVVGEKVLPDFVEVDVQEFDLGRAVEPMLIMSIDDDVVKKADEREGLGQETLHELEYGETLILVEDCDDSFIEELLSATSSPEFGDAESDFLTFFEQRGDEDLDCPDIDVWAYEACPARTIVV